MRTVGAFLVGLAMWATAVPTATAGEQVPANWDELKPWLVAHGLVDATIADLMVEVPSQTLPGIPTALPNTAGNPKGCAGTTGSFGSVATPAGVAGQSCAFAVQTGGVHTMALACAASASGFGSCFLTITNTDFLNFGTWSISCFSSTGGTGAYVLNFQDDKNAGTPGCTSFYFGSDAYNWASWVGFAGGFGGMGAWAGTVLVK